MKHITGFFYFHFMGRLNTLITKDDIEDAIDIVDIISKYTTLNKKGRKYIGSCPFHNERTPSFTVSEDGLFKCFGCGVGGKGVISFIQKKENLEYVDAIKFLEKDINVVNLSKNRQNTTRKTTSSKIITYDFVDMPFTSRHHKYFNEGELSESFVRSEGDIYAVKKFAVNKKVVSIPDDRYMFCYVHRDSNGNETGGLKFLTLGRNVPKEEKWRTNVPNSQLWYLYKYKNRDCNQIFISKSNKDALINMLSGRCAIATQSENATILSNNIPKLKKMFPETEFILNFGSDSQGTEQSQIVSKEHNLRWFNIPKKYLINGVNDPFEFVKQFGLDNYLNLLKKYKF